MGLWDISYSHHPSQSCSSGLSQPHCEFQPLKNQDLHLEKPQSSCCNNTLPIPMNGHRAQSELCCLPFTGATSEQLRHLHPESKIISRQKILIFSLLFLGDLTSDLAVQVAGREEEIKDQSKAWVCGLESSPSVTAHQMLHLLAFHRLFLFFFQFQGFKTFFGMKIPGIQGEADLSEDLICIF